MRAGPTFTEDDARLADYFADWYKRRAIEHRIVSGCMRNCNHFVGLRRNEADGRALAAKIRQAIAVVPRDDPKGQDVTPHRYPTPRTRK